MNPRAFAPKNLLLAGVLLMLAGNFMFALNDAMGKWLVESFGVGQVLLVRSVGAFLILGPMLARQGTAALLHPEKSGLQWARVIAATVDTGLFYAAVAYLPLADVIAYYMAGPIYVAAMSHFFLGERVAWRRWAAIVIGFVGVLVMLKPTSEAFSWPSIYALVGSLAFALTVVLGRRLRGTSDATLVTWQTVGALVAGAALSFWDWQAPTALDLGAMLLLGAVSCMAHLLITRSLKLAPASTLAPMQYSLLLWGVVFGLVFFNDVPGPRILIGSAIIVVSGLFIFHRQKVKGGPDAYTQGQGGADA